MKHLKSTIAVLLVLSMMGPLSACKKKIAEHSGKLSIPAT
jgi:hypothetical protein